MKTLYIIGKYITFPGAYLRGFWEQIACRLLGIPVENAKYLRNDEACGHIEHGLAPTHSKAYFVSTLPGFMNMITGWPLFLMGFLNLRYLGITPYDSVPLFVLYVLSLYVGVSLLCCQFPLREDIMFYYEKAYVDKEAGIIARIFAFIPTIVTRIGAFLEAYSVPVIFWIIVLAVLFII